ncbi:choice-of-anchor tandem repeat GloVer-containing protein [Pseudochryseolinea flava]|uniref:Ig-like domain-containing protein n=1 Tax=Pseudochryseolinea flava TaxID=2059302 RepID=A0A364Y612_9BACT|nr:choice-of-anchor tandem repeat GloVer-containing protein [Pseudochryseolinea flava]RAW02235.1 hypothetical protein DQQ10_06750 [Pseudochryseolinea flava]
MQKLLATIFIFASTVFYSEAQQQFFGTTSSGGDHFNGFIFKTDSIGNNLEIIHHFKSNVDGENISALLLASNNKLYGLASAGGQGGGTNVFNSGTFFEYDLDTDRFRVIEHLGPLSTNLPNIYTPRAEGMPALTEVSPGLIYGLAAQGRYVFSYNFNTGVFGKPFTVPNYQGGPTNGTLQNVISQAFYKASNGNLYAATTTNSTCPIGNPYMGSIFRVVPATNTLTVTHKSACLIEFGFTYNGHFAEINGKLYGTTNFGGTSNQGVIFEYTLATNAYVKRHDFHGGVLSNSFYPTSLIAANNGKLYGTTHGGGVVEQNFPSGCGTLYEYDLQTNTYTTKYNFLGGVGWLGDVGPFPSALVKGANGKLYGVTEFGVFEFNTQNGELRMGGRFWTRGFAPSIVQVCRKPSYQFQSITTYDICKDAPFTIDLASPNATTVSWKHNNETVLTQTTPALHFDSFSASDEGTWVCTMTNECGTTTSQSFTLNVVAPSQPTITALGSTEFCAGQSIKLVASEGFDDYAWSNGETTQEITTTDAGTYTVQVSEGECESLPSDPLTITVFALPLPPTSIEATGNNKLKAIGDAARYEWTLNDVLLDMQSAEITVTESGVYKARSISNDGCRSANFASIDFIVLDAESASANLLQVYPNPTRGELYLNASEKLLGPIAISLLDAKGQLINTRREEISANNPPILLHEQLAPGVYQLLLQKQATVYSIKIVVL